MTTQDERTASVEDTHYVEFWTRPDDTGHAISVCGVTILERETSALPTCATCEAYLQRVLDLKGPTSL